MRKKIRGGNTIYNRLYPANGANSQPMNFINPQNGGACSNNGIPYPNGLAGSAYSFANNNLPGVQGVQGGANHYANNLSPTLQTQALQMSGGRRRRRRPRRRKGCSLKKRFHPSFRKTRRWKGGAFSNSVSQSVLNLGRQVGYSLNNTYNGLYGNPATVNPTPWIGQLQKK
jgi:hypothetical protein